MAHQTGAETCLQETGRRLRIEDIRGIEDITRRWNQVDVLALPEQRLSRYIVGYAASDYCVELAQRLRFEVFNVELKEGLLDSFSSGLDRDQYDPQMTHLVLLDSLTYDVIGTYRLQTVTQGRAAEGIYAAQEFDLAGLEPVMDRAVECGRACVAQGHRNTKALLSLWLGVVKFAGLHNHHWLFGCCSLTSLEPNDGWRAFKTLRAEDCLHPEILLPAQEAYRCGSPERELDPALGPPLELPKLFGAYMRLGTRVVSEPALDRAFGTVDFLVLLDIREIKMSSLAVCYQEGCHGRC